MEIRRPEIFNIGVGRKENKIEYELGEKYRSWERKL